MEAVESISALDLDQEAREAMDSGIHETEHFASCSEVLDPKNEVPAGWEGGASDCQCPSLCKQTYWGGLRKLPLSSKSSSNGLFTFPITVSWDASSAACKGS